MIRSAVASRIFGVLHEDADLSFQGFLRSDTKAEWIRNIFNTEIQVGYNDQPIQQMDLRKLPAQELLQLCLQSGDQATWLEFVRRFQPLIAGVVIKTIRHWTNPTPAL